MKRFMMAASSPEATESATKTAAKSTEEIALGTLQQAINKLPAAHAESLRAVELPGPTGESNRLSTYARGTVLCLGPSAGDAMEQASLARASGCSALMITPEQPEPHQDIPAITGRINLQDLERIDGIDAIAFWGDDSEMRVARQALSERKGAILPLMYDKADVIERCTMERHICIDTTAAGGNASLLAESS